MTIFDTLKYPVTDDMSWDDIMKTIPIHFRAKWYNQMRLQGAYEIHITEAVAHHNKDLLRRIIQEYDNDNL